MLFSLHCQRKPTFRLLFAFILLTFFSRRVRFALLPPPLFSSLNSLINLALLSATDSKEASEAATGGSDFLKMNWTMSVCFHGRMDERITNGNLNASSSQFSLELNFIDTDQLPSTSTASAAGLQRLQPGGSSVRFTKSFV
jgi:hypothetical protein